MNDRRLITYLCIDTSGSMRGEPIESVNVGLRALISALRQNPYALETVWLSIITFDSNISDVLPLTAVEDVNLPEIVCPESGATFLGAALEHVSERVKRDVRVSGVDQKGDWRPLLFVLTDGKPTDTLAFNEAIPLIEACNFATVIACAAGPKADPTTLRKLTDKVVTLDTMDASSFASLFAWVSSTITEGSRSAGVSGSLDLPPPPPEVNVVL